MEFLQAFGFDDSSIQELLRSSPEIFYKSNVFEAGQLLLFLRQHLHLPEDAVLKHFKWAAVLRPGATQQSMQAVTTALQQHLTAAAAASAARPTPTSNPNPNPPISSPQELLPLLQEFPELLGWDVEVDLMPKLRFFEGLGSDGRRLLRGTMWEADSSWLPGLRSWSYSVGPKLALLKDVLGSEEEVGAGTIAQCCVGL